MYIIINSSNFKEFKLLHVDVDVHVGCNTVFMQTTLSKDKHAIYKVYY